MTTLRFQTPFDFSASHYSGWTRLHWEEAFQTLMRGLVHSASPGGARQRIPGPRSHHGQLADELEGFTRSMFMAGPWLHHSPEGIFTRRGETVDVGAFYRAGILTGTNPNHPEYWGDITDYAQHLVEMAALSWGLYLSRLHTWDKFTAAEQKQVANYLFQCTQVAYHQNNWLLFNTITNAVLKKLGMPYSQEQIDRNLQACDHMYMGEGWYRDGSVNRIDYYNAWAFHFYYLMWCLIDGDSKPELVQVHQQRLREFARDFRYFFAADGSTPCFGRSMIYRFGYLAPLALGVHMDCLDLDLGQTKTMLNLGTKFFFDQDILTDAGHLSLGYIRPAAEILEHYSCGGSPLWAAKTFSVLLLSPEHPFWQTSEKPLPIHRESFSVALPKAGFLLVGNQRTGHVQLINHKSHHDKPEYNAKYTKFAYSTHFSYEARAIYHNFNCDAVLQFSNDGINFRQRWEMTPLYCEPGFAASRYPLHEVDPAGQVITFTIVKDDFFVNLHLVSPTRPLVLREGGYALGFDSGQPEVISTPGAEFAACDGKYTFIRNLCGYTHQQRAAPFADDINGSNVRYPRSVTPNLGADILAGQSTLLASLACASSGKASVEQLSALVTDFQHEDNQAQITFYDGEVIFVQMGGAGCVDMNINGYWLKGPVVFARIARDGTPRQVIIAGTNPELVLELRP
ncbi:MAG TPA: DUF2264 domain-containing protein [Anaerolineales bacterium]|nr:DUF2264 domain-containing protein [Anaerolineales bacterium]